MSLTRVVIVLLLLLVALKIVLTVVDIAVAVAKEVKAKRRGPPQAYPGGVSLMPVESLLLAVAGFLGLSESFELAATIAVAGSLAIGGSYVLIFLIVWAARKYR